MKNHKINEALEKYTAGKATLEETNTALAGGGFHLDPGKNVLTEAEKLASTVGYYPEQANGWGLLDSGTGTLDKAEVRGGKLVGCDMGESAALYIIAGKTYFVQGAVLTEKQPEQAKAEPLPQRPVMARRRDLAGTVQRQKTKTGVYDVTYNKDGYAVKASRVCID